MPVSGLSAAQVQALLAEGGLDALKQAEAASPNAVTALIWSGTLLAGQVKSDLGWQLQVNAGVLQGVVSINTTFYESGYSAPFATFNNQLNIVPLATVYIPLLLR